MLLLLLLPAISRPPLACPWEKSELEVLVPETGLPTNGRIFIRDYGIADVSGLSMKTGGSTIAIDVIETELVLSSGRLFEIVPRADLEPNTTYEVRYTTAVLAEVTTTLGRDEEPPDAPVVRGITPNTDFCNEAGVVVVLESTTEWVLQLYEREDKLLELHLDEKTRYGFLPLPPYATINFSITHVDLAGNRSDTIGPLQTTSGAIPSRPASKAHVEPGGCTCVSAH